MNTASGNIIWRRLPAIIGCVAVAARNYGAVVALVIVSSTLICGCSGVATRLPGSVAHPRVSTGYSGYADYLRARLDVADGDVDGALAALTKARSADPDSVYLRGAQASLYMEQGKLEQAHKLLTEALQLQPDNVDIRLLLADLLYTRNRDDDRIRAMMMFHLVLRQHPQMDELYIHVSQLHTLQQDYAQGMAVIKQLLKRKPDNIQALLQQAKIYILLDEGIKAQKIYRHVISLYPQGRLAYVYLGHILEQDKQLDAALSLYKQAAQHSDYEVYFDHLRASLLTRNKRYGEALRVLRHLLQLDPGDYEALSKIGLIYLYQQQWHLAEKALQRSVAIEPLSQQYYWLGYALEQQGKWVEAVGAYTRVTKPHYLHNQALERLAYVHARAGDFNSAATTVEQLLSRLDNIKGESYPGVAGSLRPALYLQLALYYEYQQRWPQVLQAIKRGISRFPDSADLYYMQGLYYAQHGEQYSDKPGWLKLMEQSLRRAIALNKDHAGALNYLAYTFALKGEQLQDALSFARRAVAIKANGAYLDTLGWVYYKLGNFVAARQQLEQAAKKLPQNKEIMEHLGDLYNAMGLKNKAADVYKQLLKKDQDNKELRRKLGEVK